MSKPVSALNGAEFDGLVQVRDGGLRGMITLRGDLSSDAVHQAVQSITGQGLPDQRMGRFGTDHAVLWMSPDELLILCPYTTVATQIAGLNRALDGEHALVADVSDARAMFTLTGAAVRDVIAKLAPVDVHPDALPLGEVRRTRFAQAAAAFWLENDAKAQVICFRSVAQYMLGALSAAADSDAAVKL